MSQTVLTIPLSPSRTTPWTVLEILSVGLLCTILAWFAQYHWKRRRLYLIASKVKGPYPLPFLGSGLKFIGNPIRIFANVMKTFDTYPYVFNIWLGPDLIYGLSKPEYLEIVLNHPKSMDKMHLYKYGMKSVGHGIFTAPVKQWRRNRKIISPAFNQKILDRFVEVFSEQSVILIEQLNKNICGKGEFDFFEYATKCTLDVICETAMGVKVNAQTEDNVLGRKIDRIFEIWLLRMFVLWFHSDFIFGLTKHKKQEDALVKDLHEFTDIVIKRKRMAYESKMKLKQDDAQIEEDSKVRKAFLDLLIEENHFTDKELRDEVNTFIIAGSDTTATTLSFVMIVMGMFPEVQAKVYEEAIDVLGHDRMVEATDLPHFKYLDRVIKETLRLFPVGAYIVRQVNGDIQIDKDIILPKGSSAILGIMKVHRNDEYFPDHLRFDPDRFLPEEVAKRHPYSFIPFSAGPRNCIGPKYAMMALKAMISVIVREFSFTTSYKNIEEIQLKSHVILRPHEGFKVAIEKRHR